jgi:hydrogenase maturation protein HypF
MTPAEEFTDVLLRVRGKVQGVGFRPFVFRLARRLGLRGWVRYDNEGVLIRAAGQEQDVATLRHLLREQPPSEALVRSVTILPVPADLSALGGDFAIAASESTGGGAAALSPDLALCADCRTELLAPENRRHGYAFVGCTRCGPPSTAVTSPGQTA